MMSYLQHTLTFLFLTRTISHAGISFPMDEVRCSLILADANIGHTVTSSTSQGDSIPQDALIDTGKGIWKSANDGGSSDTWWKLTFDDGAVGYFASIALDFTKSKGVVVTVTAANGDETSIPYNEANMMRDLDVIGHSIKIDQFDTKAKHRLKNVAITVCRVCSDGNFQRPCTDACDTECAAVPNAKCSSDGCNACTLTFRDDQNNVVDCDIHQ